MITTERTRVRMMANVNGLAMPHYDIRAEFAHTEGEVVELHPKLAKAWIASGQAELAKEDEKAK